MAYRITYGPEEKQHTPGNNRKLRLRSMIASFALVFALVVKLIWPQGISLLQQTFLPGVPTQTQQAFYMLINKIQDGQPAGDAITSFCHQVIETGDNLD